MAELQLNELPESKNRNSQSRKWLLTINNPVTHGFSHDVIKDILSGMKSITYWCMSDEEGICTHTYHTHIFIYSPGGVRFMTVKKKFPPADIKYCRGTAIQCMEYVSKTGKWEGSEKEDTSVPGTFEESGECPIERPGQRNDLADLYTMVKSGMSDYAILEDMPDAIAHINKLEMVRQIVHSEQFKKVLRPLEIIYIYGKTGVGKTRYVMEKFGYENVYRVTDYLHPFDGYRGQNVIVFDEFRSSLALPDMLKYMDVYPLDLPCRYANKVACYTRVYFTTNIPLGEQYQAEQRHEYDSWLAFLRRLDHVVKFLEGDKRIYYDISLVRDNWLLVESSPFDGEGHGS